jgi:phosphatidylserine decarboxylase
LTKSFIAKEGLPFLGAALFFAFLGWLIGWKVVAVICLVAAVYIAYFFRDPERVSPPGEGNIVSAADGKVVSVGKIREDIFSGQERLRVSVFMNLFDVHINYSPVEGQVKDVKYHSGSFMNAALDRACEENERNGLKMETAKGTEVVLVQVAGLCARRIISYLKPGAKVRRGEKLGLIRFGSRCDIYLPISSEVLVQVGQKVKGAETVLARLKEA